MVEKINIFFPTAPHFFSSMFYRSNSYLWCFPVSHSFPSLFPLRRGHRPITLHCLSSLKRMNPPAAFGFSTQSDWSVPLPPDERDYLCSCWEPSACPVKSSSTLHLYLLPLDPSFSLLYGSKPIGSHTYQWWVKQAVAWDVQPYLFVNSNCFSPFLYIFVY